ncbi:MAG: glycosyltransferase family 4 protein [Bacteriovoracaceae bacterium]|jgi:phosphatidyl-myo-inositol dimannoside synthase|nr:glycosyltransferase family 4 protein [Bacteriovoracaceae bacterium]
MNKLILNYSLTPEKGGIERYGHNLLKFLSTKDGEVFTFSERFEHETFFGEENITSSIKSFGALDRFTLGFRIASRLKRKKIDVIYCLHLYLLPKAFIISHLTGAKIVLAVYGIECWGGRISKYLRYFERVEKIICISEFTKKEVVEGGVNPKLIEIVPPVLDLTHIPEYTKLPHESLNILTVGRLNSDEKYKGHDQVIKSLKLVKDKLENIKYHIVGRGDDQKRLEDLAKSEGVSELVEFHGFVSEEELDQLYRAADIFIMPSRVEISRECAQGEGFGIVFLEASKYGVPSIGPNIGGSCDFLKEGENALLVDPDSCENIAKAIISLGADSALREKLGKASLEKLKSGYIFSNLENYLPASLY